MPVQVDTEKGEATAVRPLRKSGNSVVVSIPPELLHQAGFVVGDEVDVVAGFEGGEISLRRREGSE